MMCVSSPFSEKIEIIFNQYPEYTVSNNSTMFANFIKSASSVFGMKKYPAVLMERIVRYNNDVCVLCLKSGIKRNASGCCDDCDLFADLLVRDTDFAEDVRITIEQFISKTSKEPRNQNALLQYPAAGITHSLFVTDPSIFSNPEKHLFYGCLIRAFFRTRSVYFKDEQKEFLLNPDFAVFIAAQPNISPYDVKHMSYCWMTCVQASLQLPSSNGDIIPDFFLNENEVEGYFHHFCDIHAQERKLTVKSHIYRDSDGDIVGRFRLEDDGYVPVGDRGLALLKGLPLYEMSSDCVGGKGGRVKAILHKSFAKPQLFIDHIWEKKVGQKLFKQTKKDQEQERKEKKERQREEQRQLDRQRREEETALRAARAALVTAVAKIDADLERINHLKELNREVALKNRKIFERKEAEKLAAAAAARHADKLKQKEAERIKFITKKN